MFTLVINNVTFDSELSESYILLYLKCIAYIYILSMYTNRQPSESFKLELTNT